MTLLCRQSQQSLLWIRDKDNAMPSGTVALVLLALMAATVITMQVVGAARDADWWVILRSLARGRVDRLTRSPKRHRR